jgi:hypothetical protein
MKAKRSIGLLFRPKVHLGHVAHSEVENYHWSARKGDEEVIK